MTYDEEIGDEEITITEAAINKINDLFIQVNDDNIKAVRIYVSGGGCGGMTTGMNFTDTKTEYDKVLDVGDFLIFIDVVALSFLRGTNIDMSAYGAFVFHDAFKDFGGSGLCGGCGAAGG
jgi:iron-sulfur cluster insertion protein